MTLPLTDVVKVSKWLSQKFRLIKNVNSAKNRKVLRGQVYWCEFGENIGSEQSEKRPALILSNNPSNKTSPNVIVAPITNTANANPSVHPLTRPATSPLKGNVLLANIKTVSKARLGDFIDTLDPKTEMPGVEDAMFNALGVANKFQNLQNQLDRTNKHLDSVKKARNTAQDKLKEITDALGLNENASAKDILDKIQEANKSKTDDKKTDK